MPVSSSTHRSNAARALALALFMTGCGTGAVQATTSDTGGTPPAGSSVAVQVTPDAPKLAPSGQVVFAAAVTGTADTAVTWSITEGAGAGAVTAAGLYSAPATAGTYHVVATSVADPTKSATATVTVTATAPPPTVAVAVAPTSASVSGCQTATFAATVTGSSNAAVTWSVLEGASGGTVSAAGVYTAPRTAGTYHVVATSAADGTRAASVPVTVANKVLSVAIAPGTLALTGGASGTLAATVTTTCGTFAAN